MSNLSKKRRDTMIAALDVLKEQSSEEQQRVLNEIKNELTNKKYGLIWEEHEEVVDLELKDKIPVFIEDKNRKIISDTKLDYNFLLDGDNLHSLHLLEKTHKGAIDVIYIDPPYNRGKNDFIYNDDYIVEEDGFKHSKWLSFMKGRLTLARTILSESGLIFISIDDNEFAQLKLLCDDIFGSDNFVNSFIWQKNSSVKTDITKFTVNTEYIFLYSKSETYLLNSAYKPLAEATRRMYSKDDNDGRGKYRLYPLQKPKDPGPETTYDFIDNNGKVWKCPNNGWRMKFSKLKALENQGRLCLDNRTLSEKAYWNERESEGKRIDTLWNDISENTRGTSELYDVLQIKNSFNNPKPIDLVKRCLQISNKNAIVLDFFAGSGTTGHAVMELNKEDGGNRKFILCTNNENNICEEVTYQRLKTVITGRRNDGSEYGEPIASNLKYLKTEWIDKKSSFLEDELCNRIYEMIELENHIEIDKEKFVILMSEKDAEQFLNDNARYIKIQKLWFREDILFTNEQQELLGKLETKKIPRNYFDIELKEGGYYD